MCTDCRECVYTREFLSTHAQKSPTPCLLFTLFKIMNTDTRTKVLVGLWYLESVGCTNETKKATRYVLIAVNACAREILILTSTEHASTTSPVNEAKNMLFNIKTKVLIKFGT